MKLTMIITPIANSTACRMCALVSLRPNRIASAQPPANAAPKTSAPIRIAAEMTVMTLGQTIVRDYARAAVEGFGQTVVMVTQTISREEVEAGGLMEQVLFKGVQSLRKEPIYQA